MNYRQRRNAKTQRGKKDAKEKLKGWGLWGKQNNETTGL
jgi:hypothetical protein